MADIKAFREANNLRQSDLAKYLETSRAFISLVESGKSKLPYEQLHKLLNNDEGWEVDMLAGGSVTQTIGNNSSYNTQIIGGGQVDDQSGSQETDMVPVIPSRLVKEANVDVMEYVKNNDVRLTPAVPQFPKADAFYRVSTDAMSPDFLPGDCIALKVVPKTAPIVNGEVYAVDTIDLGIVVRYAYDRGEGVEMRSSQERFESFTVRKDRVYNYFRVVGLLRVNV